VSNAFQAGSVGLWVNSVANLDRLPKIATAFGGMFTDVFIPLGSGAGDFRKIRAQARADGSKLRAQAYAIPHKNPDGSIAEDGQQFANRVHDTLTSLGVDRPGVVEMDIEVHDDILPGYLRATVESFRVKRSAFLIRLNLEPGKGWALPFDLLTSDPNLYSCEQTYFGDMSRVSEAEALEDQVGRGVPWGKAGICVGGASQVKLNIDGAFVWKRAFTLPDVVYQGNWSGHRLGGYRSYLVFSDDLLFENGFLR
jgi:hypothetical protein